MNACTFSPDGRYALSASTDTTLRLWDIETGQPLHIFQGHTGTVIACTFSPDGKYTLSASRDNTLRLWDVKSAQLLHILQEHTVAVIACTFSPDGKYALSRSAIHLSDGYTLQLRDTQASHSTSSRATPQR